MSKRELYDGFAASAQALASGRRVELLDVLAQGERSVDDLAEVVDLTVANCSQHLQVLRRAGLVTARRDGNRVVYRPASDQVVDLLDLVREVSFDRSPAVREAAEAYLGGVVESVSREELVARLSTGDVVVVDVRPVHEFEAGHIPTARSIPVEELEARLEELPDGLEVVAYCRGRFCAFADQAVRTLQSAGRPARRLAGGLPEWRRAGHPVEEVS
jgi:rhodanese-related sulfurtransferase/DNA-binding transcriptional ArsR family regulator